jgi:hypothetical protein
MSSLTVDINFTDEFEEAKHPRGQPGNAGQFSSTPGVFPKGQETHRGIPLYKPHTGVKPGNWISKLFQTIKGGEAKGEEPDEMAAKLKEIAGQYAPGSGASYANQLLAFLEESNGLAKGSLGKAKAKPAGVKEAAPVEAALAEEVPAASKASKFPTPDSGNVAQVNLLKYAEAGDEAQVQSYLEGGYSAQTEAYAKACLAAMKADKGAKEPGLPEPTLPHSLVQQKLFEEAQAGDLASVKVHAYQDPINVAYQQALIKHLEAQQGTKAPEATTVTPAAGSEIPPIPLGASVGSSLHELAEKGDLATLKEKAEEGYYSTPANTAYAQTLVDYLVAKQGGGKSAAEEPAVQEPAVQEPAVQEPAAAPEPEPTPVASIPTPPDPSNQYHTAMYKAAMKGDLASVKAHSYSKVENQSYQAALIAHLEGQGIMASAPPPPLPHPPTGSKLQQQLYDLAKAGKLATLSFKVSTFTGAKNIAYGKKLLEAAKAIKAHGLGQATSGMPSPATEKAWGFGSHQAATSSTPPAPAAKPTLPAPTAPAGSVQHTMHAAAQTGNAEAIKSAVHTAAGLTPTNVAYANSLLKALGQGPIDNIPDPNSSSQPQKDMHSLATNQSLSTAEKISKVQGLVAGGYKGGYAEKYGKQVLEALGNKPATTAAPASKPAPTPAKPSGVITSTRSIAKVHLPRFAGAHSTVTPERLGLSTKAAWAKLPAKVTSAVKAYTDGTYDSMNTALRDPINSNPPQHVIDKINSLDEAFEHEGAIAQEDLRVYRGFKIEPVELDRLRAAIKKGMPATFDQAGFMSCSMSKSVANGWGSNAYLDVLIPKGKRALYLQPISEHQSEDEMLLPHGQSFELVELHEPPNNFGHGNRPVLRVVVK